MNKYTGQKYNKKSSTRFCKHNLTKDPPIPKAIKPGCFT